MFPGFISFNLHLFMFQAANELLEDTHHAKQDEPVGNTPIICGQRTEASADNTAAQKMNVYIWDMDETLILLKSLLTGTYSIAFNGSKDMQKGIQIGRDWENLILRVCDEFFFYEQVSL